MMNLLHFVKERESVADQEGSWAGQSFWLALSIATLVLAVAVRLLALADTPDPWLDEAMLMRNLPATSVADLFRPMPYYVQAAPVGYYAAASLVALIAPDHLFTGLRILSLVASLIGLGLLWATLRRLDAQIYAPLVIALCGLTPFTVRYALEAKQYGWELAASIFLLYGAVRIARGRRFQDCAWFAAASLTAILFSFAAPLLIAVYGAGVLAHRHWIAGDALRSLSRFSALLAALLLASLAADLLMNRPMTALQMAVYAKFYKAYTLGLPLINPEGRATLLHYWGLVIGLFDPSYSFVSEYVSTKLVALIGGLSFAVGLVAASRRYLVVVVAITCALGGWAALSSLTLVPIAYNRHFIAFLPLLGLILAVGLYVLIALVARRRARLVQAAAVSALLAIFGAASIHAARNQEKQPVGSLVSHIRNKEGATATIWVQNESQPAMWVIAPHFGKQIGLLDHRSTPVPFEQRVEPPAYWQNLAERLKTVDRVWLIFTLTNERRKEQLSFFTRHVGPCTKEVESGRPEMLGLTTLYSCQRR